MKSGFRTAFIPLFIFFLSLPLFAENWLSKVTSTYWNYNSDFPANNALDIEQDHNGYIWIASYEGLIRFDGVDFKFLKTTEADTPLIRQEYY